MHPPNLMYDTPRVTAFAPFFVLGAAAIVVGGVIAAAIAHQPSQPLVWTVAYLVLVVGVAQCVLGAGQAWLATRLPAPRMVWLQWVVFNLGNAGVIAGSLGRWFTLVAVGTVLFAAALALFGWGVRRGRGGMGLLAYRLLLAVVLASSLIGLVLSLLRHGG